MIGLVLKMMFGDKAKRELKKIMPLVDKANACFEQMEALTDEQLREKTTEFRRRLAEGETLDQLLPEAFAAVKQACKRNVGRQWIAGGSEVTWDMIPYDVQMIGGIVLHQGRIAEMATGEGKTLVAIFPLYLNALEGRGCHLVTVNDYLAKRDSEWNGPIFESLGMRVGCIVTDLEPTERRNAYAADVTYGTNNEFGFDYLRENMATRPEYLVQNTACWQAEAIIEDVLAWSTEFGAKLVQNLHYATTLEMEPRWIRQLLERFGRRFGVQDILIRTAEENTQALQAQIGELPGIEIKLEPNHKGIEQGLVHVRINYIRHGHHYAIIDEVDSVLIDEARTPLIISGAVDRSTHRFDTIRPMVTDLVQKQSTFLTRLANEAAKELEENPGNYEAGMKLYQCQLGAPKNKRYLKLRQDPSIQRLLQKVENEHILYKKNAKSSDEDLDEPLARLENELYYVIDEKGNTIDLTAKGRHTLSPTDPDYFVLPDLVEETEKIESRHHPEIELVLEGDSLSEDESAKLIGALQAEEKALNVKYDEFIPLIRDNASFSPEKKEALKERLAEASEIIKAQMREVHEIKGEELHNISQLLRAYALFEKDVEYVVQDNKVIIVDEFTGRLQPGRRFTDGLHQALEAKENVQIEKETQTLATVTLQNYFRMYKKLAGMTGTAETEAAEFAHTYKMDVLVIPTNRPIRRKDMDDVIYRTKREKYNAIIDEIIRLNKLGLPVLVGTVSVEVSETLSRMLRRRNVSHNVLNAKYHEREAEIVRHAGQPGQVTIATNMAGRGTDIKLGPGVTDTRHDEETKKEWPGGLQIVGTERHDARRIDRQLRGRAGRQGDPGSSRFFLSLEDDLMRKFGSERIAAIMQRLGMEEGEDIQHPFVTRAITKAQKRVEEQHFEIRKKTLEYDNVMNKQREAIYGLRRQVLEGLNIKEVVLDLCYDAISAELNTFANDHTVKDFHQWDLTGFIAWLRRAIPFIEINDIDPQSYSTPEDLSAALMPAVEKAYEFKSQIFGEQLHNDIARYLILRMMDENWRDHLLAIDELREGIHLRSYAQLDPLVEYQREATLLFNELMYGINKLIFTHLFKATLVQTTAGGPVDISFQKQEFVPPAPTPAEEAEGGDGMEGDGQNEQPRPKGQTYRRELPKVGRNEPCPCGSGKKFKNCCGAAGAQTII